MSYEYRINRFASICADWGLEQIRPLIARYKIPDMQQFELEHAVALYVTRALGIKPWESIAQLAECLDQYREARTNVTPNGAIVPKRDFQLLYNLALNRWCDILGGMISKRPDWIKRVRLTPNIRIKFGQELQDNENRGLNTAIPHSDAWVEGPWGFNCYVPVIGDVAHNSLLYWKLKPNSFDESFLTPAPSYTEKQDLLSFFDPDWEMKTEIGYIYLSDFAIVHATHRAAGAKARVSIDTTVLAGNHSVHPDREAEYASSIPQIGENTFVWCNRFEKDSPDDKKTVYSHYTTGAISFTHLGP